MYDDIIYIIVRMRPAHIPYTRTRHMHYMELRFKFLAQPFCTLLESDIYGSSHYVVMTSCQESRVVSGAWKSLNGNYWLCLKFVGPEKDRFT